VKWLHQTETKIFKSLACIYYSDNLTLTKVGSHCANLDLRYKKVVFKGKVKHIFSKSDEQATEKKIIVLESFKFC
jgi:hypothetical protein